MLEAVEVLALCSDDVIALELVVVEAVDVDEVVEGVIVKAANTSSGPDVSLTTTV